MNDLDEHGRPEAQPGRTPDAPDVKAPPRPAKHSEALEVELAMLESVVAEPPPKLAPDDTATDRSQ